MLSIKLAELNPAWLAQDRRLDRITIAQERRGTQLLDDGEGTYLPTLTHLQRLTEVLRRDYGRGVIALVQR